MKEFYLDSCGGGRLHCAIWTPEGEPKAVVQLIHGIAEHIGRYDEFARFLNALEVVGWGWNGELYFLAADGRLLLNGNARTAPAAAVRETEVSWMTEWADFYEYTTYSSASVPIPQKKGIGKLLVRLELDEGASVKIEMQFDSAGVWREVKTLQAEKKRSSYLPIVPRRCDHFRIRMTGSGGCRLYSLVREVYTGSEL